MNDYQKFLASKHRFADFSGFNPGELNSRLKDWQADLVGWFCRMGRAGGYESTGLGKTFQQLEFGHQVRVKSDGKVLIVCPLAVSQQTRREAEKFGIGTDVTVCKDQSDVRSGINVTNYERLHKFDCKAFVAVIPDEASIMKNYTGKIKRQMFDLFGKTPYRLPCSATPAPNDYLELGNQAEFLGIMPSNEMIARWFSNNTMEAGGYKLKAHGAKDFWRWVSSWAVCVSMPSDLGYPDDEYLLPPLRKTIHEVSCDDCKPPSGMLFHSENVSATNMHKIKRATTAARSEEVARIIGNDEDPWLIWCDTDYEADELARILPDAVEVRGSHKTEQKEERLLGFSDGTIKRLITKPEIAGHGLNWQHCHKMVFAGVNFSFERLYQAARRCWRFGQTQPVEVHIVTTDAEFGILSVIQNKENAFEEMRRELQEAVRESQLESIYGGRKLVDYSATRRMKVPQWLKNKQREAMLA